MTRLMLIFAALFLYTLVYSQSRQSFRNFLNQEYTESDSGDAFIDIEGVGKISETALKKVPKSWFGDTKIDTRRKYRVQPLGRMTWTVFPKRDLTARFQPHAIFEVVGLKTYLRPQLGFGITDKENYLSAGFFVGMYFRQVSDPEIANMSASMGRNYVTGNAPGFYISIEPPGYSYFLSYSWENKAEERYVRTSFIGHIGEIVNKKWFPKGLGAKVAYDSFLGYGAGLVLVTPKFRIGVLNMTTEGNEVEKQEKVRNIIPLEGLMLEVAVNVFDLIRN